MSADPVPVGKRPSVPAAGAAVVTAAAVVASLVPPDGHPALAVELVGIAVFAGGYAIVRRDWRTTGVLVAAVGLVVWIGGLALLAGLGGLRLQIESLPGAVGLGVVALGLIPYRGTGSRGAVKAGAGLLYASVLAVGLFADATLGTLLLAGVGTVVAWDAGEHAIGVGEGIGRRATTRRLDAAHVGGSLVVGAGAVVAGRVVADLGSPSGSLTSLAILLVAVVLLTAALHG